jgi:DNA polymerase I
VTSISGLLFDEIWLHDFEFVARPGERPDVVCLAAHELRSGRTLRLWRDEFSAQPPYRTDDRVLFVSFVANAEMACHLSLEWPVPKNVLDLSPAFRNLTNGRSTPEGKGLIGLLRYYGLDAIDVKRKDTMRQRILQGWPFTQEERGQILKYCMSDVDSLARVLPRILSDIDYLGVALYHGEFAAVSAVMEHHGVPIDMEIFQQLADKDVWRAVRDDMVPVVDAQYGVYVRRNNSSDWTFSSEMWIAYLKREGIYDAWPRLASGALDMRRKTFENMTKGFPQLEALRQLRHTRDKMRRIKLAVGHDARNRALAV